MISDIEVERNSLVAEEQEASKAIAEGIRIDALKVLLRSFELLFIGILLAQALLLSERELLSICLSCAFALIGLHGQALFKKLNTRLLSINAAVFYTAAFIFSSSMWGALGYVLVLAIHGYVIHLTYRYKDYFKA